VGTDIQADLTNVIEITVRGLLHPRQFIQLVQQFVCVELVCQKGESVETERLSNSEQQQQQQHQQWCGTWTINVAIKTPFSLCTAYTKT